MQIIPVISYVCRFFLLMFFCLVAERAEAGGHPNGVCFFRLFSTFMIEESVGGF